MVMDKSLTPLREVPDQVLALVDAADEEAIIAELTSGEHSDAYLYQFEIEGKPIYGISWTGAKEIGRLQGNIEMLDFQAQQDDDCYHIVVRGKDIARNFTLFGGCRQAKMKELRKGGTVFDAKAWVICLNKAQRNVILHLVPHDILANIVRKFIDQGKIKLLSFPKAVIPKAEAEAEAVKPKTDPLKPLRQRLVYLLQQEMKWTADQSKVWLMERFQKGGPKELTEEQLKASIAELEQQPKAASDDFPF